MGCQGLGEERWCAGSCSAIISATSNHKRLLGLRVDDDAKNGTGVGHWWRVDRPTRRRERRVLAKWLDHVSVAEGRRNSDRRVRVGDIGPGR
jgi:hypothetical protein